MEEYPRFFEVSLSKARWMSDGGRAITGWLKGLPKVRWVIEEERLNIFPKVSRRRDDGRESTE